MESKALAYIQRKGWSYEITNDQAKVEICPLCKKDKGHFYMSVGGNKDGLWQCQYCGKAGNLGKLQRDLGDSIEGVQSQREWANSTAQADPLPDLQKCTDALMEDDDALDYLYQVRRFTPEIVQKQMLGLETYGGKKWLVIPYFDKNQQYVFAKYRTLPPAEKDFRAPRHREVPLYNAGVITKGMPELILVEGEADCISCLSNGILNVVGVPGAAMKKADWLANFDAMKPEHIFILYDSDNVGQKAAQELAQRIGVDRCLKIKLPEFTKPDGQPGKDINDWFVAGHTLEDFEVLKQNAVQFDVEGVISAGNAFEEIEQEIIGKGALMPTYVSPWASLNEIFGGAEPGDVVAIIAEAKIGKTTMADQWADWFTEMYENAAMVFCKEMPPKRLARKLISRITQTDDTPGKSQITLETVQQARAILADRKADLLYAYTKGADWQKDFDTIRQAVRRYGVKMVVFDNLQCLARSVTHQANEIFVLSKRFKELAMDLAPMGVFIVLIVQPNRVRDGEIVAARNAAGSSGIEKDVDCMIALHRKRVGKMKEDDFQGFMEANENLEPQMLVRVDLSRYAPGGMRTLLFDGAKSTIRECGEQERIVKPVTGDYILQKQQQSQEMPEL